MPHKAQKEVSNEEEKKTFSRIMANCLSLGAYGILFFNPGTAIGYSSHGVHTIGVLNVCDEIYGEIINI